MAPGKVVRALNKPLVNFRIRGAIIWKSNSCIFHRAGAASVIRVAFSFRFPIGASRPICRTVTEKIANSRNQSG
jgi:hypothetical protein